MDSLGVIEALKSRGITLRRDGDSLRAKAPDGTAVPPELVAEMKANKPQLLMRLEGDEAIAFSDALPVPRLVNLLNEQASQEAVHAMAEADLAYERGDVPAFHAAIETFKAAALRASKEAA